MTTIEINQRTPNGPIVEYGDDDDAELVEAAVPEGWRVDWETPAVRLLNGRWRAPLVLSTPLADALRAAIAEERAVYQAHIAAKCCGTCSGGCDEGDCTTPEHCAPDCPDRLAEAAWERADAAVDAARAAYAASDEQRDYWLSDGEGDWTITSRPSTLRRDVIDSVRESDWGEDAWRIHVAARCSVTGAIESYTVTLSPTVPACEDGHEHDWRSPYDLLGGLRENPGVVGHGAGVLSREVCAHCGVYQVTDTWAQDLATGEQGLHRVTYEEADEESLAWIAARRAGDAS